MTIKDPPHLTDEQKNQLLQMQFSQAMNGDCALLIHLGSTELNQIKIERRQVEHNLPLASLTLEQMYALLEARRHADAIDVEVGSSDQREPHQVLQLAQSLPGPCENSGTIDSELEHPPNQLTGGQGRALRFNQISVLNSNVIVDPTEPVGSSDTSDSKEPTGPFDPKLLTAVRTIHPNRLAYDVCGIDAPVASQEPLGTAKSGQASQTAQKSTETTKDTKKTQKGTKRV